MNLDEYTAEELLEELNARTKATSDTLVVGITGIDGGIHYTGSLIRVSCPEDLPNMDTLRLHARFN